MRIVRIGAVALGVLTSTALTSTATRAVYREPNAPPPEQSEQIPGKNVKLDTDAPPPVVEKKQKPKAHEREVVHRRAPREREGGPPDQGVSPDTARAIGTAIGTGIGLGMGMGGMGRHGDDMRMMGR